MSAAAKLDVERVLPERSDAVVFRLSGKLTDTKESYAFLEQVRGEIKKGVSLVLLNLERIEYLSSAGVGILAACYTSAKNAGGRMAVAAVSDAARKILEIVCLWEALERYPSEEQALKANPE